MSLIETLQDRYGYRSHSNGSAHVFRIDDQNGTDVYPGFCQITATVQSLDLSSVLLELFPAPHNEEVREMVERHGGSCKETPNGAAIEVTVRAGDARFVRELARAIRRVIGRGQSYSDRNWRWICPRTAKSLEALASVMSQARTSGAKTKASEVPAKHS